MFSTILSEITGNLDKRFLMNVFFPALLFSGSLVYLAHIYDAPDALKAWNGQPAEIQAVMIIAFLFIVTFFAYILDGHLTYFLRLYEGYWEGLPLLSRLLGPKKRQHQIKKQIAELQARRLVQDQELLDIELDFMSLKKGCKNSDAHRSDLEAAEVSLFKARGSLECAKSRLDEAQEKVEKPFHYWLRPDLDKAEKIISGKDQGQKGAEERSKKAVDSPNGGDERNNTVKESCLKSVENHLNESFDQSQKASGSLNKAKYKIIISDPENSKDAAALAGGKLESSARSMASLMTDLKEMIPRAMSLEARLWTEIDKIQPLKMKMDGFREDEKYNCADEAEIESREVAASLDSLEADFVAIGGDLVLAESLHLEAKNHYNCALKDLRDAKEAWSKLDISEILDKKRKSPAGDEDIAEILKKKGEVTTEANRIYEKIYFYYPPVGRPQEVMPTCLGNILKSAEMYPKERYNADAVFFWPKLYPLMSTEWTTSLANARGSLDLMVLISLLSFSFSILGGLILLIYRADPQQFLLIFWGSFVLGWVAYRGAITYAVTYGDLIRSTFDLYRDKLITELGLEAPGSMQDEKLFWNELGQWLYRNAPSSNIRYSNAKASKEAK